MRLLTFIFIMVFMVNSAFFSLLSLRAVAGCESGVCTMADVKADSAKLQADKAMLDEDKKLVEAARAAVREALKSKDKDRIAEAKKALRQAVKQRDEDKLKVKKDMNILRKDVIVCESYKK